MGKYLNTGVSRFPGRQDSLYVDKTALIHYFDSTLNSVNRFSLVAMPPGFGKTTSLQMLATYYDKSLDSKDFFVETAIHGLDPQLTNLNKFPVISFSAADFLTYATKNNDQEKLHGIVASIQDNLLSDISEEYSDYGIPVGGSLINYLVDVVSKTGEKFIMLIDEWDYILREVEDTSVQKSYLDFLRSLFKSKFSKTVFAGVFMTGIFPVVKTDSESSLNDFWEYTPVNPMGMEKYFGFTKGEIRSMCEMSGINPEKMCAWHGGYILGRQKELLCPESVIASIKSGACHSCFSDVPYMNMLKSEVVNFEDSENLLSVLLSGGVCHVNTEQFLNDLWRINCSSDVLTALIYLGYLSYDLF
ncbi:MAG: AAA family ATPase, partial [Bacteroidales bacterium]|nr:AAA family ATPase [Bacteroidales bacterium]